MESDAAAGASLNDMAKRFGVSIKSLQRDFRLAFGTQNFSAKQWRLVKQDPWF